MLLWSAFILSAMLAAMFAHAAIYREKSGENKTIGLVLTGIEALTAWALWGVLP